MAVLGLGTHSDSGSVVPLSFGIVLVEKDRVKQLTKNCRTDDRQGVHLFSFVVDHVLPLDEPSAVGNQKCTRSRGTRRSSTTRRRR